MLRLRRNPDMPKLTVERVKSLLDQGMTIKASAAALDTTPFKLKVFMDKHGMVANKRALKDYGITIEDIRRERAKGKSHSLIAEALDVSESILSRVLAQQGVKLRDMDTEGLVIRGKRKADHAPEGIKNLREDNSVSINESVDDRESLVKSTTARSSARDMSTQDFSRDGGRRPRTDYGIKLEDVRRERMKGKSGSQIAETLHVKPEHLYRFLVQQGVKLSDMNKGNHDIKKGVDTGYTLDDIKRLRKEGMSIHDMGVELKVPTGNISGFLKRRGLSMKDLPRGRKRPKQRKPSKLRGFYNATIEDVKRERAEGKSFYQIAETLGLTQSELNSLLKTHGVKLRNMDTGGHKIRKGPVAKYTLGDIKRLRKEGLSLNEIAEELKVCSTSIASYLKRRNLSITDLPGGGERPRKDYGITLEDVKRERAEGKSGPKIAEALNVSTSQLHNFLAQRGVKLGDLDTGGHKVFVGPDAGYTLDDIKRLREKGMTILEIGEELKTAPRNISSFLKTRNLSMKDFPRGGSRGNPMAQAGVLSKTLYVGAGAGASVAISKVLNTKYPEMNLVKRALISGGVSTGISLGMYAKTKNEAALWGAAGSVVGAAFSAYLFAKK